MNERKQQEAMAQQMPAPGDEQMAVDQMISQNTPDIDALVSGLSPEQQQEALENPQMLEQLIAQQMGV